MSDKPVSKRAFEPGDMIDRDMTRQAFVSALTAPKPAIKKSQLVDDLIRLMEQTPFSDEDCVKLYQAISKRLRSVVCYICRKPLPMQETKIVHQQGGPRRICEKCGEFLS